MLVKLAADAHPSRFLRAGFARVVRQHDRLHQRMTDDVLLRQMHDGDPFDPLEPMHRIHQARPHRSRQIDLRDVAGDDDLRAVAHARQEHLHLRDGRVLAFVEDNDGVIKRAAAHEGERGDLDDVVLGVALDLLGLHHVVEAVEEGSEVRVDLGRHVAGEKAEPFARLDRGPDEDDLLDGRLPQLVDRHADGEIRLAGAGGADAEDEIVLAHRVNVRRLAVGAGPDGRACLAADAAVASVPRTGPVLRRADDREHGADVLGGENLVRGEHLPELGEGALGLIDLHRRPLDVEELAAGDDFDAEGVADHLEVLIARAEELHRLFAIVESQAGGRVAHSLDPILGCCDELASNVLDKSTKYSVTKLPLDTSRSGSFRFALSQTISLSPMPSATIPAIGGRRARFVITPVAQSGAGEFSDRHYAKVSLKPSAGEVRPAPCIEFLDGGLGRLGGTRPGHMYDDVPVGGDAATWPTGREVSRSRVRNRLVQEMPCNRKFVLPAEPREMSISGRASESLLFD